MPSIHLQDGLDLELFLPFQFSVKYENVCELNSRELFQCTQKVIWWKLFLFFLLVDCCCRKSLCFIFPSINEGQITVEKFRIWSEISFRQKFFFVFFLWISYEARQGTICFYPFYMYFVSNHLSSVQYLLSRLNSDASSVFTNNKNWSYDHDAKKLFANDSLPVGVHSNFN